MKYRLREEKENIGKLNSEGIEKQHGVKGLLENGDLRSQKEDYMVIRNKAWH